VLGWTLKLILEACIPDTLRPCSMKAAFEARMAYR
jgi:hypothetical protein